MLQIRPRERDKYTAVSQPTSLIICPLQCTMGDAVSVVDMAMRDTFHYHSQPASLIIYPMAMYDRRCRKCSRYGHDRETSHCFSQPTSLTMCPLQCTMAAAASVAGMAMRDTLHYHSQPASLILCPLQCSDGCCRKYSRYVHGRGVSNSFCQPTSLIIYPLQCTMGDAEVWQVWP